MPSCPGVSFCLSTLGLFHCSGLSFAICRSETRRGLGSHCLPHFCLGKGLGGAQRKEQGQGQGEGEKQGWGGEGPFLHPPGLVDSGWTLLPGLFLVKQKHPPHVAPLVSKFLVQVVSHCDLAVESVPAPPPLSCLDLPKCQPPWRSGLPSSPTTCHPSVGRSTDTHACTAHTCAHAYVHTAHAQCTHECVRAHMCTLAHTALHTHAHPQPLCVWETAGQGRWRLGLGFISKGPRLMQGPLLPPWPVALSALVSPPGAPCAASSPGQTSARPPRGSVGGEAPGGQGTGAAFRPRPAHSQPLLSLFCSHNPRPACPHGDQ